MCCSGRTQCHRLCDHQHDPKKTQDLQVQSASVSCVCVSYCLVASPVVSCLRVPALSPLQPTAHSRALVLYLKPLEHSICSRNRIILLLFLVVFTSFLLLARHFTSNRCIEHLSLRPSVHSLHIVPKPILAAHRHCPTARPHTCV